MIPLIIFISLMTFAIALILYAFITGTRNEESDLSGTVLTNVTICLALFLAATLIGYCATVVDAEGLYEISPIGNATINHTVNTAVQKYTVKEGFITSVIISPSLALLLGFLSTCCYVYLLIRIYIGYQQITKKRNEDIPGDPFA